MFNSDFLFIMLLAFKHTHLIPDSDVFLMLYGLETVALTKRQEAEMEVAELKMLRFSLGVTRMDKIRNEYIHVNLAEAK